MMNYSTLKRLGRCLFLFLGVAAAGWSFSPALAAGPLKAGVAKRDITDPAAPLNNDPLYVKALVLDDGSTQVAIVTIDAVAIAEIGPIRSSYLASVRSLLAGEAGLPSLQVIVNASHCHGLVVDVERRTVQAIQEAWQNRVPVRAGAGTGHEDRIMENRRLRLKSGKDADVRHAYALPPDEEVVSVGPVDPEIGILRLDQENGQTLAVVYNFACHPIQGVASGGNTADFPGFASRVIEDNQGAMAFFIQGAAGDINPVYYKDVAHPRDSEPYGNLLGLSVLKALQRIESREGALLRLVSRRLELPRRTDFEPRIQAMQAEQSRLLQSLRGTSLNLKTFLELAFRYNVFGDFPSAYSYRYLHEKMLGRVDLSHMDDVNRKNMRDYLDNILAMEQLTRIKVNLALLKAHQARHAAAGKDSVEVELHALRIGEFVLTTFPGELTVQVGLNVKRASPHPLTFLAGCTNGYIFYAPTAQQIRSGEAQEDMDCLLAPEWQALYEAAVQEMLARI